MSLQPYNVLTNDQVRQVHEASLEVLETTGLHLTHPVALEKLADAGATVDVAKGQVLLPPTMVEAALKSTPKSFVCAGRTPEYDFTVASDPDAPPFMRSVGGPINYYDLATDECRPLGLQDCKDIAQIVDGLANIHIAGCTTPQDISPKTYDIQVVKGLLEAGRKHIWALTIDSKNLKYQLEMMEAVAGGSDELRRRPVCSGIVCLIEPLNFPHDEIERLLLYGKYNLPVKVPLVPMSGANAPYTLAGTVAQTNAEALGSFVLLQTLCPGIPTWYYVLLQDMEMGRGGTNYASPEVMLMYSSMIQMARHYGVPSAVAFLTTDCQSHQILFQRGAALTMYALSGVTELGAAGGVDGGLAVSPMGIVLDEEFNGYVCRLREGFRVDRDRLAVEAIHRVGHAGNFLSDEHTYQHLRTETRFKPTLIDLQAYATWKDDPKTIVERARDRTNNLLRYHEVPPLEDGLQRELDRIMKAAEDELGAK